MDDSKMEKKQGQITKQLDKMEKNIAVLDGLLERTKTVMFPVMKDSTPEEVIAEEKNAKLMEVRSPLAETLHNYNLRIESLIGLTRDVLGRCQL